MSTSVAVSVATEVSPSATVKLKNPVISGDASGAGPATVTLAACSLRSSEVHTVGWPRTPGPPAA